MNNTIASTKILVVEDERDYATLLAIYLKRHGYSVSVSLDGEAAWRRVMEEPPGLITLDYMMPNKTGLKLYRDLRQDQDLREIPIVLITGITAAGTKGRNLFAASSRLRPIEGYLEKPVSEEDLVSTIDCVLKKRRSSHSEKE